jgi:hypothetical protein
VNGWLFRPDRPGVLAELIATLPGVDAATRRRLQENALASSRQVSPQVVADLFAKALAGDPS